MLRKKIMGIVFILALTLSTSFAGSGNITSIELHMDPGTDQFIAIWFNCTVPDGNDVSGPRYLTIHKGTDPDRFKMLYSQLLSAQNASKVGIWPSTAGSEIGTITIYY